MPDTDTIIEIAGCQLIPANWPLATDLIEEVFKRHGVDINNCFDEMLEEHWAWYTIERPGAPTWCTALKDRNMGEWWFRDEYGIIHLNHAPTDEEAFREYLRQRKVIRSTSHQKDILFT